MGNLGHGPRFCPCQRRFACCDLPSFMDCMHHEAARLAPERVTIGQRSAAQHNITTSVSIVQGCTVKPVHYQAGMGKRAHHPIQTIQLVNVIRSGRKWESVKGDSHHHSSTGRIRRTNGACKDHLAHRRDDLAQGCDRVHLAACTTWATRSSTKSLKGMLHVLVVLKASRPNKSW